MVYSSRVDIETLPKFEASDISADPYTTSWSTGWNNASAVRGSQEVLMRLTLLRTGYGDAEFLTAGAWGKGVDIKGSIFVSVAASMGCTMYTLDDLALCSLLM